MKYEHWYEYKQGLEEEPPTLRDEILRLRKVFRSEDRHFDHTPEIEVYCLDHKGWFDDRWHIDNGCRVVVEGDYGDETIAAVSILDYLLDYKE